MKKVSMMTAVLVSLSFISACAQSINAGKVPKAVTTAFEQKFPGIVPKWEKEKGNFEAGFKQNGATMSALFEANGTIKETEMDIKVSDLPVTVTNYVKEHYKGKTIREGAKITKADGTVNYEAEVAGTDVIFDAAGKFLKEEKD